MSWPNPPVWRTQSKLPSGPNNATKTLSGCGGNEGRVAKNRAAFERTDEVYVTRSIHGHCLTGVGFNSTCGTCPKHRAIRIVFSQENLWQRARRAVGDGDARGENIRPALEVAG